MIEKYWTWTNGNLTKRYTMESHWTWTKIRSSYLLTQEFFVGSFWNGIKNSFIKFRGILTLHSHKCSIKKQHSFLWWGGGVILYLLRQVPPGRVVMQPTQCHFETCPGWKFVNKRLRRLFQLCNTERSKSVRQCRSSLSGNFMPGQQIALGYLWIRPPWPL